MKVKIVLKDGSKIVKKTTKENIDIAEAMVAQGNNLIVPCNDVDLFVPKENILYIEFQKENIEEDEDNNQKEKEKFKFRFWRK